MLCDSAQATSGSSIQRALVKQSGWMEEQGRLKTLTRDENGVEGVISESFQEEAALELGWEGRESFK